MASAESDNDESNDTRSVSDLTASFEAAIVKSASNSYRAISRINSFAASTLKETTKKKDEQETDVQTTKGVQTSAPKVSPKPQRKHSQKNEKASNIKTTEQHQYDAKNKKESNLDEMQDEQEKRNPNNYKQLMKESREGEVELEENVGSREKEIDNKTLHQRNISNLNETYLLRQDDVNVTQQAPQQYVVTDNQQQNPSINCSKCRQLGQAHTDPYMDGEIQQLRQEKINLRRENELLKQENDSLKKAIGSQKRDNGDIINEFQYANVRLCEKNELQYQQNLLYVIEIERLEQEINNLKSEIEQEISDHADKVQQLQQQNTKTESDINGKEEQLVEATNEIQKLKREHANTISKFDRMRRVKQQLRQKITAMERDINSNVQQLAGKAKEIQQLQQRCTNTESDRNSKVQQLEEATNEFDNLQQNHAELKDELQEVQQENNNLKSEIERLKQEINDHAYEIQQLQQQNTNMESDINSKEKQLQGKTTEIRQLQERCTIIARDQIRKDQELQRRINAIQQLEERCSNMESDRNSKVQQLQENGNKIQKLQLERIETQKVIQGLQQQNSNMRSEIEQLQQQKTDMSERIKQLEQEIKTHTNTLITESGLVVNSNEELGRGAYGAVYKGEYFKTPVAVKEYYQIILSPYYRKNIEREIRIASQCRHPNLLQFICAAKSPQHHLLVVTELMDTTLRTLLEQRAKRSLMLTHQEIKSISSDVARGLNYLHQKPNPIIHRDISSANVLLWIENNSVRRAKISDYGAANFMQMCNTHNPGAILYAAPEASGTKHDPKVNMNTNRR